MGLTDDIYKAFVDNMSDADGNKLELTKFQKKKTEELAENLKEAFINFLVKQTFTIKEMKALLEVETITTSTPLKANVEPTVNVSPGIPVTVTGQTGITNTSGNIDKISGREGVTIPKLDLGKDEFGSQGGNLDAVGYAYIGLGGALNRGEPNNNFEENKVKINREDIVEE